MSALSLGDDASEVDQDTLAPLPQHWMPPGQIPQNIPTAPPLQYQPIGYAQFDTASYTSFGNGSVGSAGSGGKLIHSL